MPFGLGKKPQPPKPVEEMTPEELEAWKQQNKKALFILGVGCVLAAMVIIRGVIGMVRADGERKLLFALSDAPAVAVSVQSGYDSDPSEKNWETVSPAQMDQSAWGAPVFGDQIKIRDEIRAVLSPAYYLWLPGTKQELPPQGEITLMKVTNPSLLTDSEKADALCFHDTYYLLSLRGKNLASAFYAVRAPQLFLDVLEAAGI